MMNSPVGCPWSVRCRTFTSVPQIDATSTFRRTSPGPGCGTGRDSTRISSAPWSITTVMVSGITMDSPPVSDGLYDSLLHHQRHATERALVKARVVLNGNKRAPHLAGERRFCATIRRQLLN